MPETCEVQLCINRTAISLQNDDVLKCVFKCLKSSIVLSKYVTFKIESKNFNNVAVLLTCPSSFYREVIERLWCFLQWEMLLFEAQIKTPSFFGSMDEWVAHIATTNNGHKISKAVVRKSKMKSFFKGLFKPKVAVN